MRHQLHDTVPIADLWCNAKRRLAASPLCYPRGWLGQKRKGPTLLASRNHLRFWGGEIPQALKSPLKSPRDRLRKES